MSTAKRNAELLRAKQMGKPELARRLFIAAGWATGTPSRIDKVNVIAESFLGTYHGQLEAMKLEPILDAILARSNALRTLEALGTLSETDLKRFRTTEEAYINAIGRFADLMGKLSTIVLLLNTEMLSGKQLPAAADRARDELAAMKLSVAALSNARELIKTKKDDSLFVKPTNALLIGQ